MQTYRGRITLADGDEVDVDLEMTDEAIRLTTDAAEIGTWARAEFRIAKVDDGVFEIAIDGDRVSFEPFEPAPFEESFGRARGDASDIYVGGGGSSTSSGRRDSGRDADGAVNREDKSEIAGNDAVHGEDAGGLGAGPLEGEEVTEWSLVTPNGSVENGWTPYLHVPEDPGPSVAAPGRHPGEWPSVADVPIDDEEDVGAPESSAVEGEEEAPVELWSISGPRWSVIDGDGGREDELPDVTSPDSGPSKRSDTPPWAEPEEPVAAAGDLDDPSKAETPPRQETGWNYELLAQALAELDEDSAIVTPGDPVGAGKAADPRDAEAGMQKGGRFGGSSVERLAAAVNSLKRGEARTPADEAVALAREEADDQGTVAEGILATQRSLRETTVVKRFTWDLIRKVGAGVLLGVGIAAVVVLLPDAWEVLTRDQAPQVTTIDPDEPGATTDTTAVTATTVPVTTLPEQTTTTIAPEPTVFDLPASQFVETWNGVAAAIDPVLAFGALPPIGEFENQFFAHLSMLGVVGEDGTISSFSLVIDPTGPAEADRLGIQALGVALKVLDPDSTGSSRAALLRSLGLDVDQPNLAGIDSSSDLDGVRYALRYDSETVRLTLSLSPVGPGEA